MGRIKTNNYDLSANIVGPKNSPRAVLLHPGFCETWRYRHIRAHAKSFASLGCLAIAYDAPGIWGSKIRQGSPDYDNQAQMQGYSVFRQVDAGREIIELLKNENPSIKITSYGHSLGGLPAVYEAAMFGEEVVDSVILDRAAYSWRRESNEDARDAWENAGTEIFRKPAAGKIQNLLGISEEIDVNSEFSRYASVYNARPLISNLEIKKLQIAARYDTVVLLPEVEVDFALAAEPKELVITDTDHSYLSPDDIHYNDSNGKRLFHRPKRPYSNPETIKESMDIAAGWMERNGLLPYRVGRQVLRCS